MTEFQAKSLALKINDNSRTKNGTEILLEAGTKNEIYSSINKLRQFRRDKN